MSEVNRKFRADIRPFLYSCKLVFSVPDRLVTRDEKLNFLSNIKPRRETFCSFLCMLFHSTRVKFHTVQKILTKHDTSLKILNFNFVLFYKNETK